MAYREAVVVIHGMGEQRPLETLRDAAKAVMSQYRKHTLFYSRPANVADSYEARRYIIPPIFERDDPDRRPQTDLFEYHWAHLMQGNRLDDLWPTVRRIMLRLPGRVPGGIRGLWMVLWLLTLGAGLAFYAALHAGELTEPTVDDVVRAVVGAGVVGTALAYAFTRLLPGWLTGSFVDVVRYLDTSPRSYEVRRAIREGAVELLTDVNEKYDRVVIVAHSLGSYIAYDAISYLWGQHNRDYAHPVKRPWPDEPREPAGLHELEVAAAALGTADPMAGREPRARLESYRQAQRDLWEGLRDDSHRWKITDLVTLGSPMYMADQLYTTNPAAFDERVERHEFPTCPPREDYPSWRSQRLPERVRRYSYPAAGRRVLYDAAPFAVVRWTNLWFPTRTMLFGDWFGGALAPLFGPGVKDVDVKSGSRWRLVPGYAHARYFAEIASHPDGQLAGEFHAALRR